MKVKDFKKFLDTLDQNAEVVVEGQSAGGVRHFYGVRKLMQFIASWDGDKAFFVCTDGKEYKAEMCSKTIVVLE